MDKVTKDERPTFEFEHWRRGRVFYSGDWHLGHERIIPLCHRPFGSVTEMNQVIIDNTNAVVTHRDTLVLVGDVLLGKFDESVKLLRKLRAKRIWLIPGNHDRWSLVYGHHGSVETVRTKRRLFAHAYQEQHGGIRCEPDRVPSGWRGVVPLKGRDRTVLLSHYPYIGDSHTEGDRFQQMRPRDRGMPLIHGHVHNRWQKLDRMFNVGVDVNEFRPVSEATVGEWLESLPLAGATRQPQELM